MIRLPETRPSRWNSERRLLVHRGRYQGRWFKYNLILVHLSATPLDDTVHSETLRLNLNSLLWHQPIYHYVINLSVILASRCILLLPFGNVNFCLNRYPRWRAAIKLFYFAIQSCI